VETPEAYAFTAESAVAAAARVVAGEVQPGAWTPAQALGAGFVATLPGVVVGELRA
jgi:saccharopine dehydrogenase (NAD+, L-lysine-forming)